MSSWVSLLTVVGNLSELPRLQWPLLPQQVATTVPLWWVGEKERKGGDPKYELWRLVKDTESWGLSQTCGISGKAKESQFLNQSLRGFF